MNEFEIIEKFGIVTRKDIQDFTKKSDSPTIRKLNGYIKTKEIQKIEINKQTVLYIKNGTEKKIF